MTFIILFCVFECEVYSILFMSRNFREAQLRLFVRTKSSKFTYISFCLRFGDISDRNCMGFHMFLSASWEIFSPVRTIKTVESVPRGPINWVELPLVKIGSFRNQLWIILVVANMLMNFSGLMFLENFIFFTFVSIQHRFAITTNVWYFRIVSLEV